MNKNPLLLLSFGLLLIFGCAADDRGSEGDGGVDPGSSGSGNDGYMGAAGQGTADQGTAGGSSPSGTSGTNTYGVPVVPDQLGVTGDDWTVPEEWMCGDAPCECADGIDNDGDGVADGFDMECTGPLDDDEGSFATGIPGDNQDPKWQDCFFDGDSGGGNDGCRYHTDCLTGALDQDDPACQLSQYCIEYCMGLTPNGCDCFGCCEIHLDDGSTINVMIGGDCSEENLDECQTCVPTDDCYNECGECELCPGMTIDDLPDYCWPDDRTPEGESDGSGSDGTSGTGGSSSGGGTSGTGGSSSGSGLPFSCANGAQACLSSADCPAEYYCLQGCCIHVVL